MLAERLNSPITVVETPGFGMQPASLTATQRIGLAAGRADSLARVIASSVLDVSTGQRPYALLGYSLGASVAAAAAGEIARSGGARQPRAIVLIDPPGVTRWRLHRFVRANQADARHVDAVIAANSTHSDAVLPLDRRDELQGVTRRLDLAALVWWLSRGTLAQDLAPSRAPLELIRFADSHLCPRQDASELVALRASRQLPARMVELSGTHATWHALDALDDIAAAISFDTWSGK